MPGLLEGKKLGLMTGPLLGETVENFEGGLGLRVPQVECWQSVDAL